MEEVLLFVLLDPCHMIKQGILQSFASVVVYVLFMSMWKSERL